MNRSPEHRATAGNTPRRQPVPHLWGMYPAQPEHHTWGEQGEQPPHRHPPKIPVQHRGPYRRQAHPRPPLTPYTHTRTIMLAVHGGANELSRIFGLRGGPGVAGVLRLLVMLGGDLAVLVTVLGLLSVPIGQLLLSGAVTGVVVGIAAQQSLGHAFAGLVLLMARPFTVGDCITLRSGGLGGQYDGEVTAIGLIYTTLHTGEGPMSFPNSTVLAAATGRRSPEHTCDTTRGG